MKNDTAPNTKLSTNVIRITVIALAINALDYFLIRNLFSDVANPAIFYGLGFMVLFMPVLAVYLHRQQKSANPEDNDQPDSCEIDKTALTREIDESEARYRVLVENSPAGIITCDLDGNITTVNPATLKLLGSPSAQATKQINVFTFGPLVECGIAGSLKKSLETGEIVTCETFYTTKWGKKVYMRMHCAPLHSFSGAIVGVQGILEDFTANKKAQDQLKTYYHVIEHSPVAVLISDNKGQIEYINPKYVELTGYTPDDVIGNNVSMLYARDQASAEYYQELLHEVQTGNVWRREAFNVRKNGEGYWENISVSPVLDENGQIYHFVVLKEDITKRREESEKAKYLAYHDSLTGLSNRSLFYDRLMIAVANAARYQSQMAVMFLDLDGFKEINDTYGHDTGDDVLKAVAEQLKTVMRKGDTVARMGGDEFTLIVPEFEDIRDVELVAEKILKSLRQPLTEKALLVTPSIGIAFYPQHGINHEALLSHADKAMYQAKKQGKNNYQIYEPDQETTNPDRHQYNT
ncbi:sensor domain-containing protein [Acetobacterium wieringae]|uniref:Cyclic di-GMP phosphodiesterase Gmr n=1 Tax=Acetobacterium wieringae TaxID=52694 RepID=A0A1F2PHS7_9FIRM|nr:sensor domain-containing diguanylate cyclase [Acetobacterium wieringae]OFV70605.1 cyclic di-GMP phosphodiesterase Gmr [Acetobacterium wieringae]